VRGAEGLRRHLPRKAVQAAPGQAPLLQQAQAEEGRPLRGPLRPHALRGRRLLLRRRLAGEEQGPDQHERGHSVQGEQAQQAVGVSVPGHWSGGGRRRRQEGRQAGHDHFGLAPRAARQADEDAGRHQSPLRSLHHSERDKDGRCLGRPLGHAPAQLQRCLGGYVVFYY